MTARAAMAVAAGAVLLLSACETGAPPAAGTVEVGALADGYGQADAHAALDGVSDVRLELLRPANAPTVSPERNLFRFAARTEAPPRVAAPPPERASLPVVPTGPPPPPPIPLRFIGLLDAPQSAGRVALLSDGRGNVVTGKEGDIIEGRYRLVRIGADSAELAYLDGRGRQVVRLSGQ